MSISTAKSFLRSLLPSALLAVGLLSVAQVCAQPANRPLLTNQAGARPNLMIALDNSGSMAYPYDESYGILYSNNANNSLRFCPAPLKSYDPDNGFVVGGKVAITNTTGSSCLDAGNLWVGGDAAYAPARIARNNLLAMRSADANPVYYNPRTTYSPRLGPDYQPLARPANPVYISNQGFSSRASQAFYQVYRNPVGGALYSVNVQKPAPTPRPAWATPIDTGANTTGNRVYGLFGFVFPTHLEYTDAGNALTPKFTYTYCRDAAGASTVERDTTGDNRVIGCSSARATPFATSAVSSQVTVYNPGDPLAAGNIIQLPSDHTRTDCAAGNTCTNAEELVNVLNWYHWYSTRQLATSTAIGQALAQTSFQNNLRIGYMPINDYTLSNTQALPTGSLEIQKTPGTVTNEPNLLRGVRTLSGGTPESTQLYTWLNNIVSRSGTPLHNAITRVANYYRVNAGATENPWATDPSAAASPNNPEMSCRRSFNLLFSDGGWTTSYAPAPGTDFDNTNGPVFSRTLGDGSTENFQYQRLGDNSVAGRLQYAPFPSTGTGGLADLTAGQFWHTDLRPALENNVQTRAGQPTFWQNMTTYTVGYFIRPTGEVTGGAGLTFNRIDQYRTEYALNGFAAATKPVWPTGNLVTTSTSQQRVDDFIQAGYTGGGRSFSARSAEDIRTIFSTIVADILSASGRDAGVSVSSSSSGTATLSDSLKYTVSYRTLDNSGDITARELDDDGNETGVTRWSAGTLMPEASARNVFTMTGTNQPINFAGTFTSLPQDVRDALRQGPDAARVPNNANFINYLRGDNAASDAEGKLFRQRASKLAAMVNPPSVLMNGAEDYGYDSEPAGATSVDGFDSYYNYLGRKLGYPSSLFVATNAGFVHSFEAELGQEQAAFMPRRSLKKMLAFAKEPYNFEYVLDGPISQNDIFDRPFAEQSQLATDDQWRAWRHLAVGSGGRGEPLVYAINSPLTPGAVATRAPERDDFLWETGPDIVNAADGEDVSMGYISNTARAGQTEDLTDPTNTQRGNWIVAVNNGHYNGEPNNAKSGLMVLNALTGAVIRTIPLPPGFDAGRGLSGVTLLRNYKSNKRVVAAYAGDAKGQLWRFNLSGAPNTWHVEHNQPIFTVPNNRPIYGHPAWQPHPNGGFMVVFATGIMLEEADLDDQGAQSIYGIWDRTDLNGTTVGGPFAPVLNAQLVEQNVVAAGSALLDGNTYFSITNNEINWNTQRGWRMPLLNVAEAGATGERSIADVINIKSSVQISTTVLRRPATTEMCTASNLPANYVYRLNALTASQDLSRSFDTNGDGRLNDDASVVYLPSGGFTRGSAVISVRTDSAGVPLPDDTPPPPPPIIGDPFVPPESVRDGGGDELGAGARGEYDGECEESRDITMNSVEGSLKGGTTCPKKGWSRTQYQLSAPPSN